MAVSNSGTGCPTCPPTPSFMCVIHMLQSKIWMFPFDMKQHVGEKKWVCDLKTVFCVFSWTICQKIFGPLFLHTKQNSFFLWTCFGAFWRRKLFSHVVLWGQKQLKKKSLTSYQQLQKTKNNLKGATELNFSSSVSIILKCDVSNRHQNRLKARCVRFSGA